MTDDELDAIETMANRTSPGPWASVLCGEGVYIEDAVGQVVARQLATEADGFFIISAQADVPALVSELRAARERLNAVNEVVDSWYDAAIESPGHPNSPSTVTFVWDLRNALRGGK